MGHKRKAPPPSPLKLLSMLDARYRKIPLPEIARRTQHSISSIMRWTDKFGEEVSMYHALIKAYPHLEEQLRFEAHYPATAVAAAETPASDYTLHINKELSDLIRTNLRDSADGGNL